jgi:hypothetical protein
MLTLIVAYSGRIPSQALDRETVALEPQDDDAEPAISSEPNFLLSSRSRGIRKMSSPITRGRAFG